jgi:predicted dehydrogenase
MPSHLSRRQFLQASAAGAGLVVLPRFARGHSPNEKLNIAMVGTANQARFSIDNVKGENIVAVCDIDDRYLAAAVKDFPRAKTYNDFRKMLERKDIDAVVVATPDHMHAPATLAALQSGRHVYCEKPLTHTVEEARKVAEAAKKYNRATQMGTQIHAEPNYRRVVEVIRSGAIGPVREVHVWVGKVWSGSGRPTETPPVPSHVHWDLWLGPAPERPYHPAYLPGNWRGWWDFGGGTLADMACHYMDLPFWALELRHPTVVEASGSPYSSETTARWTKVQYEFPSRQSMGPVKLTWYDGGKRPKLFADGKLPGWGDGVLFIGDKGMMLADYGRYVLLPEKEFAGFQAPPKSIPDSIGHHAEWIRACKDGSPTTCNFDYSGALTESVLLGAVAYRVGKRLSWDPQALRATGCPEADPHIRKTYRRGWSL